METALGRLMRNRPISLINTQAEKSVEKSRKWYNRYNILNGVDPYQPADPGKVVCASRCGWNPATKRTSTLLCEGFFMREICQPVYRPQSQRAALASGFFTMERGLADHL